MTPAFSPGDLVRARGREWVALPSTDAAWLYLRPLAGNETDVQLIDPSLEVEEVRPARFDLPTTDRNATQDAALLIGEALRLSLRRGADHFVLLLALPLNRGPTSSFRCLWLYVRASFAS